VSGQFTLDSNEEAGDYDFDVRQASDSGDAGGNDQTYDDQLILDRTVGEISEFPVTIGDVNKDGSVTTEDAQQLTSLVNEPEQLTEYQKAAGDVDGDGDITGSDVNTIMSYATSQVLGGFGGYVDGAVTDFEVTPGDVNQDGSVTAQDAMLIQDYVRGDADLSAKQKAAADVDGDGKITAQGISDDDGGGDDRTVTLRDTFRGNEFTATLTPQDGSTWRYQVVGMAPSPNYEFAVETGDMEITGVLEETTGNQPLGPFWHYIN